MEKVTPKNKGSKINQNKMDSIISDSNIDNDSVNMSVQLKNLD